MSTTHGLSGQRPSTRETVQAFWAAMATNDFAQAAAWLAKDYLCEWPQSGELVCGRENFVAINANYPANGRWTFTVNRLVAEGDQAVSDVLVSDGTMKARAVTFHTVRDGFITRQTEFWPDDYAAPAWRSRWITKLP